MRDSVYFGKWGKKTLCCLQGQGLRDTQEDERLLHTHTYTHTHAGTHMCRT